MNKITSPHDLTNPVLLLQDLIRCPSVTPVNAGALETLIAMLEPLGFACEIVTFSQTGTPDIANLYATLTLNDHGKHLMFAGHTDVVPTGDEAAWSHPPFDAAISDGMIYGRGTADMKGGIACFVAAVARAIQNQDLKTGKISLLITGDEEGPALNGTIKLLEWAAQKGEKWDGAIVGEPTNPDAMGDAIKIGRRGSLSGTIIVKGRQGHVAYPHLAINPARGITALVTSLMEKPLDAGSKDFQPTNLEVTSIDIGNKAVNVIPSVARAQFNVRFNDHWTAETLQIEILARLNEAAKSDVLAGHNIGPVDFNVEWNERPSDVFLTRNEALIETLSKSVDAVTGRTPQLSTGGGTSDARFIKNYCPVIEFGLVGQTMHMIDERVAVKDLETLTQIYARFLNDWF